MTPLIGWLLVYLVAGFVVVIVILAQMARLSGRDMWFVLSITVGWPAFLAAAVAHRVWARVKNNKRPPRADKDGAS